MKTVGLVALVLGLFVLVSAGAAYGDDVSPGETFDMSLTATQTGGSNCCSHNGTLGGSLTIGSEIGTSSDWTVSTFSPVCTGTSFFGSTSCASLTWKFAGLEFDASDDTLIGQVSTNYNRSGGDSATLTITFEDHNTADDPYTDVDNVNASNSRNGTISYSVSAPEPSSLLLSGIGLLSLIGMNLRRKRLA